MKNSDFPLNYFFDTFFEQTILLISNMPATYITLLISLFVKVFNISTNVPIYIALGLGILLKLILTFSMRNKTFKEETTTIVVDMIAGILIALVFNIGLQWTILFLTLLFLLYQAFALAKAYQRLSFSKNMLSEDLKQRHQKQMRKTGKRRK